MSNRIPPTPPPRSTSKPTATSTNTAANTRLPSRRAIQDHGTVGAVANAGSDLSYDLSSTSSAVEFNVYPNGNEGDDYDSNDDNNSNRNKAITMEQGLPNEVLVKDDVDDDVSLDHKLERDTAVLIEDLHQLHLDRSRSAEAFDDVDNGNDGDDDHSGDDDYDNYNSDEGLGYDGWDDNEGGVIVSSSGIGKEELDLEHIANLITSGKRSNVVVLSGAGVSCAAGIPDFRTPGTGLYDNLEKYNLPYPEAVFDLAFYQNNPLPFVSLAKEIWPGIKHSPTLSHSFLSLLSSKNLLLRNYTQNIDGLELLAGVQESEIVECHGSFRTSSCIACGIPYDGKLCKEQIVNKNEVPICPKCGCLIKPDIVFFGESLPVRFKNLYNGDLSDCDLLIVMGTSLKVAPVSLIPEMVNSRTLRVLFNLELVGDFVPPGVEGNYRDVFVEGTCDDSVMKLCKLLGWEEELLELNESTNIG